MKTFDFSVHSLYEYHSKQTLHKQLVHEISWHKLAIRNQILEFLLIMTCIDTLNLCHKRGFLIIKNFSNLPCFTTVNYLNILIVLQPPNIKPERENLLHANKKIKKPQRILFCSVYEYCRLNDYLIL